MDGAALFREAPSLKGGPHFLSVCLFRFAGSSFILAGFNRFSWRQFSHQLPPEPPDPSWLIDSTVRHFAVQCPDDAPRRFHGYLPSDAVNC
jgi:hypothetical protein